MRYSIELDGVEIMTFQAEELTLAKQTFQLIQREGKHDSIELVDRIRDILIGSHFKLVKFNHTKQGS